jgi:hypothetical protein
MTSDRVHAIRDRMNATAKRIDTTAAHVNAMADRMNANRDRKRTIARRMNLILRTVDPIARRIDANVRRVHVSRARTLPPTRPRCCVRAPRGSAQHPVQADAASRLAWPARFRALAMCKNKRAAHDDPVAGRAA